MPTPSEQDLISGLISSPQYHALKALAEKRDFNLIHKLEDIFSENCSSRFLRYFLGSDEDHALGLSPFLALVEIIEPHSGAAMKKAFAAAKSTKTVFNWCTPNGRFLDLLLTGLDENRKPIFVIGLENKIGSVESENQVGDYQKALIERYPNVPKLMLYLTLKGNDSETALDISECPAVPVSHRQLSFALNPLLSRQNFSPEVRLLFSSYITFLTGDVEMEKKTKDLVRELMLDPNHRKALSLIEAHTPTFRGFLAEDVIPEIETAIGQYASAKWMHPLSSPNPNEVNLEIGKINATLRKKKAIKDLEGIYYTLKCGDNRHGEVSAGDTFDLLLMVYGSPNSRRGEIFSELGKVKLPSYEGTPRQWSPWTCIWAGGSYTLKDLGKEDIRGLTRLVKDAVDATYSALAKNL